MKKYQKILGIVTIGFVIALNFFPFIWTDGKTDCEIKSPDIVGLDYDDVIQLMNARGLRIEITDTLKNAGFPNGQVVAQNPPPSMEICDDFKLSVTINWTE